MTFAQLGRRYDRRATLLNTRLQQAANGIRVAALALSREKMTQLIYALPVDRTARGRPRWRRTGALRRGELGEVRQPIQVVIVNRIIYAVSRHEAGKPGHRSINPIRIAHWRDEMFAIMRPIALESWRDAILQALRG